MIPPRTTRGRSCLAGTTRAPSRFQITPRGESRTFSDPALPGCLLDAALLVCSAVLLAVLMIHALEALH